MYGQRVALHLTASVILVGMLTGCMQRMDKSAIEAASPETIGVIIGHDYRAKTSNTAGEELLVGFSFGLVGSVVSGMSQQARQVGVVDELNEMAFERVEGPLRSAGYSVELVKVVPNEWDLFGHIEKKQGVYPELIELYDAGDAARRFDALLFVELLVVSRVYDDDVTYTMDNLALEYAKSKLMLYTPEGDELYFDMIQKGYSTLSKATIDDAIDDVITVEAIPPRQ